MNVCHMHVVCMFARLSADILVLHSCTTLLACTNMQIGLQSCVYMPKTLIQITRDAL